MDMPTIPFRHYNKVCKLYTSGRSAREIANSFAVSIDAVYYFLRKYKIERRTASQNNKIRFERSEKSFVVKKRLTQVDRLLKIAGIMLYWGEGSKSENEKIVDFANSDPYLIQLFLSFLRSICGIDEHRLRVYVYCHDKERVDEIIAY